MVAVAGRLQLGEVGKGTGRARLCEYVKHSTLNSAIEQELRVRRVEARPQVFNESAINIAQLRHILRSLLVPFNCVFFGCLI